MQLNIISNFIFASYRCKVKTSIKIYVIDTFKIFFSLIARRAPVDDDR